MKFLGGINVYTDSVGSMIPQYDQAVDFLDFSLDALQCQRPFYADLFEQYMQHYHLHLTDWFADIWNKRYLELGASEIISIIDILFKQCSIIETYGMTDPRFAESWNELTQQFAQSLFGNIMPMILDVANKSKTDYSQAKDRFVLNAPVDLFKLLNTVFDNYYKAQREIVMRGCLSLCYKLVSNFQSEFDNIVTNEQVLDLDVVIAMTNSNIDFIEQTKNFTGTISRISKVPKADVEMMFSQGMVIKNWANTSNVGFQRVQKILSDQIADSFLEVPNYKKFEIEGFCDKWFSFLMDKLFKLNKSYGKKCWATVYGEFTTMYVIMVIKHTDEYKPADLTKIAKKVEDEVELINNVFSEKVPEKEYNEHKVKMEAIKLCFSAPQDILMIQVGVQRLQLKDGFNENSLRAILKLRSDLPDEIKLAMYDIMKEKEKALKTKDMEASGKSTGKSIMLEFRIMEFVTNLRKKLAARKAFSQKREENGRDNDFLKIDPKEKFEIEEMALHKRGEIDISFNDIDKNVENTKVFWDEKMKAGGFFQFEKKYFFFGDDTFCWKPKFDSKANDGRIFLSAIVDLNFWEDKPEGAEVAQDMYLYFKVGLVLYTFHFFDEVQLKEWSKAVVYLRDEALLEFQPVEYRKFSAVPDERKMEEIFLCDKPNYDYAAIKIQVVADRKRRELGLKGIDPEMEAINAKTTARSDEELSNSDDERMKEEDGKGVKSKGKAGLKKLEKKMMANPKSAKFYTGFKKFLGF